MVCMVSLCRVSTSLSWQCGDRSIRSMRAWGLGLVGLFSFGLLPGCAPVAIPVTSEPLCRPGPMGECNVRVTRLYEAAVDAYSGIYAERTDVQGEAMGALAAEYQRWLTECAPLEGASTHACRELAESIGLNALTVDPGLAW